MFNYRIMDCFLFFVPHPHTTRAPVNNSGLQLSEVKGTMSIEGVLREIQRQERKQNKNTRGIQASGTYSYKKH